MKKILLAFLVLGVFLYGCTQPNPPATTTATPTQTIASPTPTVAALPTLGDGDVPQDVDSDALGGLGDDELEFPEEPV